MRAPVALAPMIAPKGSITLDGVSLTVNDVEDAGDSVLCRLNIIPHTAQHTTLGQLKGGQQLNVEIDVLARYIDRMVAARAH
jgi:riboflavin synthase